MSGDVLLDTHIALWLDSGNERLQETTRDSLDACWRGGGTIYLSAISVWEIALLVDMNRIALDVTADTWAERFVGRAGVKALPLDPHAAARAYRLEGFDRRDPADRLLVASAIVMDCPLVTYDASIAGFARRHGRRHGLTVMA